MTEIDKQSVSSIEQTEADEALPQPEPKKRLRTAYGGIEHTDEFHVIVEQDGKPSVVPSGAAIQCPPAIELVYVLFNDGVEYQCYTVELEANITPSSEKAPRKAQLIHRLRQQGSSEWDEPWAVEVALEERPDGWLVPTELKFEGLAKHAKIGDVVEGEFGGREPEVLQRLV